MFARKALLLLVCICLVAAPALADKAPRDPYARTAPREALSTGYPVDLKLDFEGFEGSFPPVGWSLTSTNPTYTWERSTDSAYEGTYGAFVGYDDDNASNEVLSFSHAISTAAGEDHLVFVTMGSIYWTQFADFSVEVNGSPIFSFFDDATTASWVWGIYGFDLSAFDGQTVTIAFRYQGQGGADQHLDAVQVRADIPPPPSACDSPFVTSCVTTSISGNTCDSFDFINDMDCGTYYEYGRDEWYRLTLFPNGSLTADVTFSVEDGALWIVDDCAVVRNCLAYADDTTEGEQETISYTNDTGANITIYLVVDSWGTGSCGAYTGTLTCTGGVPEEAASWGALKAQYRR
jgi:hypothetical protein